MPTPVPWGGVDVDCQLPGEPPQAASCRSYGGMWYRELGVCIPGTLPGGIPSFPATPYAPAPPATPQDQVAAQVCTLTGGTYSGGQCNYPRLGVTRTRSQLVDSDYTPPAGWTPPAGGCPQGQVGWPPVCVPVPNTLPPAPAPPACPQGQVWDAQAAKCLDPSQVLPPGEEQPQPEPATEDKLPAWVIPAAVGGAAFVILAALVMRQPKEMQANRSEMRRNPSVRLGYDALNVFQRYWWGQWDPLYAMLSRRGNSVAPVTLDVSDDELERFEDVAKEIVKTSDDPGEVRTARIYLKRIPAWKRGGRK
jgi:hypothetical protein